MLGYALHLEAEVALAILGTEYQAWQATQQPWPFRYGHFERKPHLPVASLKPCARLGACVAMYLAGLLRKLPLYVGGGKRVLVDDIIGKGDVVAYARLLLCRVYLCGYDDGAVARRVVLLQLLFAPSIFVACHIGIVLCNAIEERSLRATEQFVSHLEVHIGTMAIGYFVVYRNPRSIYYIVVCVYVACAYNQLVGSAVGKESSLLQ